MTICSISRVQANTLLISRCTRRTDNSLDCVSVAVEVSDTIDKIPKLDFTENCDENENSVSENNGIQRKSSRISSNSNQISEAMPLQCAKSKDKRAYLAKPSDTNISSIQSLPPLSRQSKNSVSKSSCRKKIQSAVPLRRSPRLNCEKGLRGVSADTKFSQHCFRSFNHQFKFPSKLPGFSDKDTLSSGNNVHDDFILTLLTKMASIAQRNKESIDAPAKSKIEKQQWWETRLGLDSDLKLLIEDLQHRVLGAYRGLVMGEFVSKDLQELAEKKVEFVML